MDPQFDRISFEDREEAARQLAPFLERNDTALTRHLAEALETSPDPMRAAIGLNRYVDACLSRHTEFDLMAASPRYMGLLVTLFSQSHFLAGIAYRYPQYISWLWEEAPLERAKQKEELVAEITAPFAASQRFETVMAAMRRAYQREILRIAIRDIFEHAALQSVTEDLSNLADAMLEAAFAAAERELVPRFGRPMAPQPEGEAVPASFVVFAMGKLGGRELNFSSDIDLVFVYSDEGKTEGGTGPPIENTAYYKKVGELLIKALSERTNDGIIFRVDMRLRPFGTSGPLATAFDSALEYYIEYGRAWERQALVKARPCAGDIKMGQAFLKRIRPFVFPKYFDDATLEEIRDTKRQTEAMIERKGQTEYEVKLGRGGIRDIEFTVQMLQLLNGGRWPELRTTNTLEAIDALGRCQSLSPFEATSLASHYVFLRQVEHRLQIEEALQCHALPSGEEARAYFARRMGFGSLEAFDDLYRERTDETRRILERFLAAKGGGTLWIDDLLNPFSDGAAGLEQLAQVGFEDPEKARVELLNLARGAEDKPFRRHVHQQFAAIAPFLLNALSFTARPDEILLRLSQVMARMSAPATLYELLKAQPVLSHFLVTLAANSDYLCGILIREPGLLDTLSNIDALDAPTTRHGLETELGWLQNAYDPQAALYRLRDGEMLRVALRELARDATLAQVGDELTALAEVVLAETLRQAREKIAARYGPTDVPFAILGLGKVGGWEMGYGSDLDLVFVYEASGAIPSGVSTTEYFAAVAAQTIRTLKEPTAYGILYDVDARLRPDGNKGVLAIDHEHLRDYYLEHAQPWERHALMKARAVAGDYGFARRVEKMAKDIAFSLPGDAATVAHIESLRKKAVEQASPLDLKKREGGMSEIEFTVRLWQLRHVRTFPELKRGDVFGALDILRENELIAEEDWQILRQAYRTLRRILNRLRMMRGSQVASLPEDAQARAELAARLGIEEDVLGLIDSHCDKVHALYERTRREASTGLPT